MDPKDPVTPGERQKNARGAHAVRSEEWVVRRCSFAERAGPTIFIRGHSLGALGYLRMHNTVRGAQHISVHARRTPDMREERWTSHIPAYRRYTCVETQLRTMAFTR